MLAFGNRGETEHELTTSVDAKEKYREDLQGATPRSCSSNLCRNGPGAASSKHTLHQCRYTDAFLRTYGTIITPQHQEEVMTTMAVISSVAARRFITSGKSTAMYKFASSHKRIERSDGLTIAFGYPADGQELLRSLHDLLSTQHSP